MGEFLVGLCSYKNYALLELVEKYKHNIIKGTIPKDYKWCSVKEVFLETCLNPWKILFNELIISVKLQSTGLQLYLKWTSPQENELADTQDSLLLFLKYFSSLQQVCSFFSYQYTLVSQFCQNQLPEVRFFFFGATGSSIV